MLRFNNCTFSQRPTGQRSLATVQPLAAKGGQRRGARNMTRCAAGTSEAVGVQATISTSGPHVPEELLPKQAQGLVFDCDGTVVDSMAWHYEAWKHACDAFGLPMSPQLLVDLAGTPADELFGILLQRADKAGQVDKDAFFSQRAEFYANNDRTLPLVEPVMQILHAGKARGLKMAIASGGDRHHVRAHLESCGILHMFDAVVTCEDVERGKPAPDSSICGVRMQP